MGKKDGVMAVRVIMTEALMQAFSRPINGAKVHGLHRCRVGEVATLVLSSEVQHVKTINRGRLMLHLAVNFVPGRHDLARHEVPLRHFCAFLQWRLGLCGAWADVIREAADGA